MAFSQLFVLPIDVTCPHCAGQLKSCHVCQGAGRIGIREARDFMRHVWAIPGCACQARLSVGGVRG